MLLVCFASVEIYIFAVDLVSNSSNLAADLTASDCLVKPFSDVQNHLMVAK